MLGCPRLAWLHATNDSYSEHCSQLPQHHALQLQAATLGYKLQHDGRFPVKSSYKLQWPTAARLQGGA
jgi:hypothetical protein